MKMTKRNPAPFTGVKRAVRESFAALAVRFLPGRRKAGTPPSSAPAAPPAPPAALAAVPVAPVAPPTRPARPTPPAARPGGALTPATPAGGRQRAAAHAAGYAAGAKAQRERWQAVLTDPAAAGCSDLALTLCRDTDMPAGAIVAALAAAGQGAASLGPRLNRASLRADRQAAALASSWDRAMQGAAPVATRGKPD